MSQVSMTVRMDSQLKAGFDSLCQQFGMSANTAMNVFARAVVQQQCIPFIIGSGKAKAEDPLQRKFRQFRQKVAASDCPELTLDEINEEIRLAREEMAAREKTVV